MSIVLSIGMIGSIGTCFGILMFLCRYQIAGLYTQDLAVREMVIAAFPALCTSIVTSMLQSATAFAMNGLSRNGELAVAKSLQLFVLLPVGLYLGFFAPESIRGFQAMMWAHPINHMAKFTIMSVMLLRTDWHGQVEKALTRSESR